MKTCKQRKTDIDANGNLFATCCGSFAFNLHKEYIDQGDLCDVHYWKNKYEDLASRVNLGVADKEKPPKKTSKKMRA